MLVHQRVNCLFTGVYRRVSTSINQYQPSLRCLGMIRRNRGPAPLPPRPCLPGLRLVVEQLFNDDPKMGKFLKYQMGLSENVGYIPNEIAI